VTFFRLLWEVHKWIGITAGLVLLLSAGTGLLLLVKKRYEWIQPVSQQGTAGAPEDRASFAKLYHSIFSHVCEEHPGGFPAFRGPEDIDRFDVRPDKNIVKARSRIDWMEVQLDFTTGEIANHHYEKRNSDWIEQLHDGQLIAEWWHEWGMPVIALTFLLMVVTGYLIWLWPKYAKRRARRRRQNAGPAKMSRSLPRKEVATSSSGWS
jgi:uncharacterized iron-regulated membrane protein